MVETLAFLARLPVLLGASPFYLPPGAPLAAQGAGMPARWSEADLVRCRLTALGPAGTRDEVYTLFVAARILNFLKGLTLPGPEASLAEALAAARASGLRGRLGADGLEGLLTRGVLAAATRTGSVPLRRFRAELFRALWTRLGWVTTREGVRIRVDGGPPVP
ncbi:MAG: B12-binding domain-containing radical SAM protein, partial [Deferrisomatales bacterium]